ncbi:MAG: hypothetical protein NXH75_02245 [Halobacteriovoraceae bacterium]|nr:hypothetical protein [Halobacteriovoraceae bacterium]
MQNGFSNSHFLQKYFFYLFIGLGLFVHHQALISNPLVDIDRAFLLNQFESFSLREFWDKGLFIYDVIPIRDISIFIFAKVKNVVGFQLYGLFNLSLWISSVLLVKSIFKIKSDLFGFLLLSILLAHPLVSWVIPWPTANKHLLSLFFSLSFVFFSFKTRDKEKWGEWGCLISYFLMLNSQPINLLIPFSLILIVPRARWKDHIALFSLLLTLMILYTLVNFFYYHEVYPLFTNAGKFAPIRKDTLAINFLGVSRGFSQILLPFSFATYYSPQNILGLLGFPVFFFSLFLLIKKLSAKELGIRIILILSPFIVIYSRPTNVFVSDPYYLLPLCVLIPTLGKYFERLKNKEFILLILILFILPKSLIESRINTNEDQKYWKTFLREPSCKSAISSASFLMKDFDITRFKQPATFAIANKCLLYGVNAPILARNVYSFWAYLEPKFKLEDKKKLLRPQKNATLIQEAIYLKFINKVEPGVAKEALINVREAILKKEKPNVYEEFILKFLESDL